ncbi:GNAT family N-acetyltransferase [Oceanobacillus manasiensis]|uniref:hypothetical protein n=1 Tax=Oceanobacillus manasiensis TaxID=586413 RepID=UPI000AED58D6|nr:hypothetical protein [Oceanobacillus manasiensis]
MKHFHYANCNRRSQFLMNRIKQSEKCLVVKDNNGTIVKYGLSILGPVVCENKYSN